MFCPTQLITANVDSHNPEIPRKYRSSLQFDYVNGYVKNAADISDVVSNKESRERLGFLLSTFLAHWGMFRGSSNLKDTNIIFFKDFVHFLLKSRSGALMPIAGTSFEDLQYLEQGVISDVIRKVGGFLKDNGIAPTATLISKTVLALLGNMPAYDRIFCEGLKKLKDEGEFSGVMSFGEKGLSDLSKWYGDYSWPAVRFEAGSRRNLPTGRLVDLAIFQYGRT